MIIVVLLLYIDETKIKIINCIDRTHVKERYFQWSDAQNEAPETKYNFS